MCGIVGVIGDNNATMQVLEGLKRLEYRGYDSSGIAHNTGSSVEIRKSVGKISALEEHIKNSPFTSTSSSAIGHTRWATHGAPNEGNAHPHKSGACTVVHNGIIENYQDIKTMLESKGRTFASQTDTEVIPALIDFYMSEGKNLLEAVQKSVSELEGAFAITVMHEGSADTLIAARRGAPLVVGFGDGCNYVGSDPIALAPYTNKFLFLEEDDIAEVTKDAINITRPDGSAATRQTKLIDVNSALVGKAGYNHFMLKEVHEQPDVVSRMLEKYLTGDTVKLPELPCDLSAAPQINIIACGTAYCASLVGKYMLETAGGVPVNVDAASEFRYRNPPLIQGGIFVAVSQSGETADTLAAVEHAKANGQFIVALTNTPTSSIARISDAVIDFNAGTEIAVASTKCFIGMLTAFNLMALKMLEEKGAPEAERSAWAQALRELPTKIGKTVANTKSIEALAQKVKKASSMLYLGRGQLAPIAIEGALKIKEISYIHAEAYASGEMKHGPIALVDETLPVVNLASSSDGLLEKTISNMQEVNARGGQVILVGDKEALKAAPEIEREEILVPMSHPCVAPILFTIPMQLLAYHVAVLKGTDVDQPRNLAKSVTVE
ncbi:MAG: glutamine--fructose-6-phosphate transaminase (isomerizing) [Alphaproteobacteria bacterium]|nr:glutamine--fructose-6-phosphate transaminase (isomerizing) [Alphaproteobacteria bacterium]